jgi:hypothetical protein
MPVFGRSAAGVVTMVLAPTMCRMTGITDDSRTARRLGVVVGATDIAGVVHVVASSTTRGRRRAAVANAVLDVVLATGLLALAARRDGAQRVAAIGASASVWFGAGAWLVGAYRLALD